MSEVQHPDLTAFMQTMQKLGVNRVALAYRAEWGPAEGETIDYGRQHDSRLLAYHTGTLHICQLTGTPHEPLAEELRAAGFTVELRPRNLAEFDQGY